MAHTESEFEIARQSEPALPVRLFGWAIIAFLAGFLVNNVLIVGFDVPKFSTISSDGGVKAIFPALVYLACVVTAFAYVLRDKSVALRWDARQLHKFNIYLIRVCFWTVLLVGIVDATIAVMRVEKLLILFVDDATVKNLALSKYVGTYVHIPLIIVSIIISLFTRTLGFVWLALMIVGAELLIVISRFIFSYEQALMGDLVRYWYAALFLFASAYTLFEEGHVRVDVLYAGFTNKTRGFVNAIGSIFLGISTCWVILVIGLKGKQSIINAPVLNFEITQTGSVGMFVKYQMAVFLAIFAITMMIQFVSYFFEAVADYRDDPGHIEHEAMGH